MKSPVSRKKKRSTAMATVKLIGYEEAGPELREVYNDKYTLF
jgi:hypothetical protein